MIITKDEEQNIERCLKSVAWAAETIVIDAYSSDRTVELARQLGAQVTQREWPGYARQKNFGIGQARQPWVLSLDADEEVSPALGQEIAKTVASEKSHAAYRVLVPTYFLGRPLRHYGRAPHDPGHIRLFRRGEARFDDRRVHERLEVDGSVGTLRAPVLHYCYPRPSLRSYSRKIRHYARLEAEERAAEGTPWGNRWVRAGGKLAWMLIWRRGILHGPHAWIWIVGQGYQEWLITGAAARLKREERAHGTA